MAFRGNSAPRAAGAALNRDDKIKKRVLVTGYRITCKLLFIGLVKCLINTNSGNDWRPVGCTGEEGEMLWQGKHVSLQGFLHTRHFLT